MGALVKSKHGREKACRSCIWMQAGVIRKKTCNEDYHCITCRFDRMMGQIAEENQRLKKAGRFPGGNRGKIISWKDKLKELTPAKRPCLHHMKGHIEFRACTNEYRCGDCEFDQYFHDQYTVYAVVEPVEARAVQGFMVPQGYYFHPGHTWVKMEEDASVRVGMDDFALRLLGPLDCIKAPVIGKEVRRGREDISLFRGSNRADIRSPVSGVVTSINAGLRERGSLANEDPFTSGWIMRVHTNNLREDLRHLTINTESEDFMDKEVERLYQVIEEVGGPMSTDGGSLGNDIYGGMPQLGWERLAHLFLRT